ncbi:metallophosphoesterase [Thermococcus sp. 9N3]|uniref:metallophosphoesterase n=1 Tax=Thermococcus sp. 9N3 TaxID=163002 RepID=UPI00142F5A9B|nr:metallophosphoesterase [Thermococcus sp. 9N3]NJE49956.1 metallophosphoesterase [Thermococcus sp. 9N3]
MIAVLSDTHVGDKAKALPIPLLEKLEEINPELILHAGDVTSSEVLETLEEIAPVIAVRGNVDHLSLPEEETVEVEGMRIGVIHGHQLLSLNAQFLSLKALDMEVDLLVFGHTHRFYFDSFSVYGRRVYLLNPGSPTFPRWDEAGFAVLKPGEEPTVRRVKLW